jgi:hypothetical protein
LIDTERNGTVEIREFTTYHEKSPITGYGIWIVIEEGGRRVHLLHPFSLSELIVNEVDFVQNAGAPLWPVNATGISFSASKFMEKFKKRIAFFIENKRPFNMNVVAKALAGMEEITHEEAMKMISELIPPDDNSRIGEMTNKSNRVYRVSRDADLSKLQGRPRALIDVLLEHGPASIYQLTSLADGRLKTKTDMRRVVTYFVNKLSAEGILELA